MKEKTIDINHYLIKELARGSESAAHQVYQMYAKAMYNTLIRITGDSNTAQDLLQDAFVKAFDNISSYRGDATFGAWLKQIVVNTGLGHIRKKKLHFEPMENLPEIEDDVDEPLDLNPSTVHSAIKQLPDGSRTVLSLYLLEGYSHKEIAKELSITESTSKTQYMRAKKILKENLKHAYYG